jgi:hypothetical protein
MFKFRNITSFRPGCSRIDRIIGRDKVVAGRKSCVVWLTRPAPNKGRSSCLASASVPNKICKREHSHGIASSLSRSHSTSVLRASTAVPLTALLSSNSALDSEERHLFSVSKLRKDSRWPLRSWVCLLPSSIFSFHFHTKSSLCRRTMAMIYFKSLIQVRVLRCTPLMRTCSYITEKAASCPTLPGKHYLRLSLILVILISQISAATCHSWVETRRLKLPAMYRESKAFSRNLRING